MSSLPLSTSESLKIPKLIIPFSLYFDCLIKFKFARSLFIAGVLQVVLWLCVLLFCLNLFTMMNCNSQVLRWLVFGKGGCFFVFGFRFSGFDEMWFFIWVCGLQCLAGGVDGGQWWRLGLWVVVLCKGGLAGIKKASQQTNNIKKM